ncbi:aurora kinase A and ninein-interacting protein [Ochotona princeps]|uniref:aurora kinase A and ninein-interacting protein n=1 Tax=Ochotona princeps TaxID=9978 RepID=UPI002714FA2E|nr:aurora kinase A and ninein-interacting protein [Ochotona princeps]
MRRRGPEEEACGVWLDAAALKRHKVQTHLIKPVLTLLPKERKASISLTQRRTPPAGGKQTSITSFLTSQPGKRNSGGQRSVPSHVESQINQESTNDATPLGCLVQGSEDDYLAPPFATSTPADTQGAGLCPHPLQTYSQQRMGTPLWTEMSLLQPSIPVSAAKSKTSLAFSFTQDLESSWDQNEEKDSSRRKEWLHDTKKTCQGLESPSSTARSRCHQSLDRTRLEKIASTKENRQVLQTHRDFRSGEKTDCVKQSPHPVSVLPWDSENDRDTWSQLFTEDSQGQQVIAHKSRAPFQDISSSWNQELGQFSSSPRAQSQDGLTRLFTQDSEGNQVIRHPL